MMDDPTLAALAEEEYDPVEEYAWDWRQDLADDEAIRQHILDSEGPWSVWQDEEFFSVSQLDADNAGYPECYR